MWIIRAQFLGRERDIAKQCYAISLRRNDTASGAYKDQW